MLVLRSNPPGWELAVRFRAAKGTPYPASLVASRPSPTLRRTLVMKLAKVLSG
jgi:hypothetical protein